MLGNILYGINHKNWFVYGSDSKIDLKQSIFARKAPQLDNFDVKLDFLTKLYKILSSTKPLMCLQQHFPCQKLSE